MRIGQVQIVGLEIETRVEGLLLDGQLRVSKGHDCRRRTDGHGLRLFAFVASKSLNIHATSAQVGRDRIEISKFVFYLGFFFFIFNGTRRFYFKVRPGSVHLSASRRRAVLCTEPRAHAAPVGMFF